MSLTMHLLSVRRPLQFALCAALVYRLTPSSSVPLVIFWICLLYTAVQLFIIVPFRLFVYLPFFSPLRYIPSPPPGLNTWETWLAAEPTPPKLLAWVNAAAAHHGQNFRGIMRYYGIGGEERILIISPAALKEVLVQKQYEYFDRPALARKRISLQAGNGLIASEGENHKNQKRKLLPAFTTRAIQDLYPLFCSKADELVAKLHSEGKASASASVEVVSWTSRSALDIIGVAAWGKDFRAISEPNSAFLKSYSGMFDISGGGQLINALALALPMRVVLQIPCAYNTRLKAALASIRTRCAEIVRERKKELSPGSNESHDKDILGLLIKSGIADDDALVDQMMTMLAAGHDTSSLTLAWACYLLGKHKDVQHRLREELRTRLPVGVNGFEQEASPAELENMKYLSAVTNEVLRLMPSVPTARREALRATQIQQYYVPQSAHIVTSSYVANRLKDEWGIDAENFNPDRWFSSKGTPSKGRDERSTTGINNKFAFHSFSHGPRSCIGQSFARAELLVFIAALVASFEIELEDPDYEPTMLFGITMSPAGGIRIRFKPAN